MSDVTEHHTPVDQFAERTGAMRRRRHSDGLTLPMLRVVAGRDLLAVYAIYPGERVVVGRDAKCNMVLTDASVSRRHAVVFERGGQLFLEDFSSTNGTAVGPQPVQGTVPLPIGAVFYVGNVALRVDPMSIEEIQHLERVADRLRQVVHDPLTGLLGRGWLDEELPPLVASNRGHGLPLSALFVDVDHFKRINDTHGHALGDEVLRRVSRLLDACVRDLDRVVRYGGEEFLVLLGGCDEEGAMMVGERIRSKIAEYPWHECTEEADAPLAVTVSVGAARLGEEEEAAEWLERADQAMYVAKATGRDRVVSAERSERSAA